MPHPKRSRRIIKMPKVMVPYRGKNRGVVLELDSRSGNFCVRLTGCRIRRTYSVKDLWNWKVPQLQLPLQESSIRPSEVMSEEEVLQGFAEIRRALSAAA